MHLIIQYLQIVDIFKIEKEVTILYLVLMIIVYILFNLMYKQIIS